MTEPNRWCQARRPRAELADLPRRRAARLDSLPEPQELYLELLLARADFIELIRGSESRGYALAEGRTLLEFHLEPAAWEEGPSVLAALLRAQGLERILCLSFDALLLGLCLRAGLPYRYLGRLYRDRLAPGPAEPRPLLSQRPAAARDLPYLFSRDDEAFEPLDYLPEAVRRGAIRLFSLGAEPVGVGFLSRVVEGRDWFDVGAFVEPAFRRRGLGRAIVRSLAEECEAGGGRPIAGCGADNGASQAMLAAAGFRSRHGLVEFLARPGSAGGAP